MQFTFSLSKVKKILTGLGLSASIITSGAVLADTYEVTLTNITKGQAFTPRLGITHTGGQLFSPGAPAIAELVTIAEGGDISPLMGLLDSFPQVVTDMSTGDGLLMPGESQSFMIEGDTGDQFTLINMIIPTNDGFTAVNGVALPESGTVTYHSVVYDAGSETNDELCANIPGPVCGGAGGSPEDDGEGYIYIHPGIQGIGDLESASYDWRNPAAMVVIRKL